MHGETLALASTPDLEGSNRIGSGGAGSKLFGPTMIEVVRQGGGAAVCRYPKLGSTIIEPEPR